MKRVNITKLISFLAGNTLLFVILFFIWNDTSCAQSSLGTIEGVLIDQDTNESIPSANVYISNTTFGAPSNSDGSFRITNIPAGNYELVIQFIGFSTRSIPISMDEGEEMNVGRIELQQQPFALQELEVTSSHPRQWRRELKRFTQAFIGSSFNAKKTTIENPKF